MATMKTYHVTNEAGAYLRDLPSTTEGKIVVHLPRGALVKVCEDWCATNGVGSITKYLCIKHNGTWLWCVSGLLTVGKPHVNHLDLAASAVGKVYGTIYELGCRHASGAKSLGDIKRLRVTTCSSAASAVLQAAGCLPVGKTVSHTAADGKNGATKTGVTKAIKGVENLIPDTCEVVRVNCVYGELPAKYKAAGMVYVQDSNICVSGGNGVIYSCNQTGGAYGKGNSAVKRTGGYPFEKPVIYVIAPRA